MGNLEGFDAGSVERVVPAGRYEAVITDSRFKPTKSGTGKFLELKVQILSGPSQNRTLLDRLNLQNDNPTAVQIAQGTLADICWAVGILTPNDSSELHNIPLAIQVVVSDSDRGPRNEIKRYYPRGGGSDARPAGRPVEPTAQQGGQSYGGNVSGDGPPPGVRPW